MTDRELIDELDRQLEYEELHAPLEAAIMAMRNRLANPPTALASRPDGWRGIESGPMMAWQVTEAGHAAIAACPDTFPNGPVCDGEAA